MKKIERLILIILCLSLSLSFSACHKNNNKKGSDAVKIGESTGEIEQDDGNKQIAGGRPVTITVDLHGWMPTINTEPTAEDPEVFLSTQVIADEFIKLHPNVTIKWARTKPVGGLQEELAQWFTTQIAADNCPEIAFSWGTSFVNRGWYEYLTDDIETPNLYVDGNGKWKDNFPKYLFNHHPATEDKDGNIVAIPIVLFTGPPTGWFYNKDIFDKLNIKPPKNWNEFISIITKAKDEGYIGATPWGFFSKIELSQWFNQFSIGPSFAGNLMDKTDYDKDGIVSQLEELRAIKEGIFNPLEHEYAKEYYRYLKHYLVDILPEGWQNTDYFALWNDGQVAMREEGMWALQSENNNKAKAFEFGAFPWPIIDKGTSEYTSEIKYTEKGPYQPDPDLILNVMKPAVEKSADKREAAVEFLKFLTIPENISMMVLEQGSSLGAVKGAEIPPLLTDWMQNSFPIVPKAAWPLAVTDQHNMELNKEFELWIKNSTGDNNFFKIVDDIQQKGADYYIETEKIDTADWKLK